MNPFNHDTPPLFVQQDSPISKVELLIKDLRQAHGQKRDLESRDEPFAKDVRGLEHQSEIGAEDVSGKSTASTGDDWPNLDESQESNINLHWVSLRRPVELESSIRAEQQFRAFIIGQQYSHSRLSVSKELFEGICSSCSLPIQFEDILKYFGSRNLEVEVAAPRLRFHLLRSRGMGSFHHGFACTYGLRFIELNNRGDPQRMYSLRQMAVCHQEETDLNIATWVFVGPSSSAMLSCSKYLATREKDDSGNPFDVHLMLFKFAISSWRPYLVHLAKEVHQHVNIVLAADSAGVGPISLSGCGDLQRLKQLGDEMSDTTLALSTTCDAVKRLSEGYAQYGVGNDAQCKAQIGENEDVYYQLMEHSRELDWLLQQTDGLRQKLLRTSQLVSSFMDLGNGRSLEDLGKEARIENTQIHEMTKKSTQDAAAVKILTIMMLVYLPATVVLNFFSTSFVNSDTSPGSSGHLIILKNWWIVVIISVPLTVLTLYVWWVFTGIQTNGTYPRWWNMIAKQNLLLIRRKTLSTDEESNIRPTSTESAMGVGTEKL